LSRGAGKNYNTKTKEIDRITNPKKVQGFYDSLPPDIKDKIDK
jgi:hypothetical protein